MSRRLLIGLQIAGTLLLAGVLFRRFDWEAFFRVTKSLTPWFYFGSLLTVALGQALFAWRWRVVLSAIGAKVAYADAVRQYFIGLFFSNLLPTAVGGDAVKVYYLGRAAGYPEVGASVIVDRVLGFLWLSVIGAALAWIVGAPSSMFELNRTLLSVFAVGFIVLLVVVRVVQVDRLVPPAFAGRPLVDRARALFGFFRAGACRASTLAVACTATAVYIVVITLVYQQFFRTVGVMPPSMPQVMLVIISTSIFVNVPISVNGIGLREQLHYLLFAALGLSKEVAVSISLLMFSHMLLVSLLGCGAWLRAQAAPAPLAPTSAA